MYVALPCSNEYDNCVALLKITDAFMAVAAEAVKMAGQSEILGLTHIHTSITHKCHVEMLDAADIAEDGPEFLTPEKLAEAEIVPNEHTAGAWLCADHKGWLWLEVWAENSRTQVSQNFQLSALEEFVKEHAKEPV